MNDPSRRADNPEHPYWQLVDDACEMACAEQADDVDLELRQLTEFPEIEPAQFAHDVEITILRRLAAGHDGGERGVIPGGAR